MRHVSTHSCNNDPRLYRFERTSGLPIGYFERKKSEPDRWVFVACVVLALGLILFTQTI